jgi:hypothetical protein
MATRRQLWHQEDARKKIQTSQLINRLTNHALADKPIMDASQVKAAQILLAKAVPDLSSVELSGANGGPIEYRDINSVTDAELLLIADGRSQGNTDSPNGEEVPDSVH